MENRPRVEGDQLTIPPLLRSSLLSLGLSALGAAGFALLGAPLPYLLGPILLGAVGAVRLDLTLATPVRDAGFLLLGLQIGAAADAAAFAHLAASPLVALIFAITSVACMAAGAWAYARVGRWDRETAFLASVPGALSTVLALVAEGRANASRVVLAQMARLSLLIGLTPVLFHVSADGAASGAVWTTLETAAALASGVLAGLLLSHYRTPAAFILGPAAAVGVLNLTGLISGAPHPALLYVGLAVIGGATGARIVGAKWSSLRGDAPAITAGLCATLLVSAAGALLAWRLSGIELGTLALLFAPGAFDVMIAVAISLNLDPALVAAGHVVRLLALTAFLPLAHRAVARR